MVWLKIQWKSPTNLPAGLIHLQSCVRPSISFTAHRLPLNAAQMTDGLKCNQITMAGNDKNVKTHVLDRKLAILEQLMPKSWSDFNSCNVSSLKSGIVWSSMARYKYRPQGDYWGTLCLFFFTPYPFFDIFFSAKWLIVRGENDEYEITKWHRFTLFVITEYGDCTRKRWDPEQ